MIITLYVNGDSHTAGTYKNYFSNLEDCATALLAKKHNLNYINRARAGGSNNRIIRISKENLTAMDPNKTIVLIGWSTFDRTEWFEDGTWHQICGQPWYNVSDSLKARWTQHIETSQNNYEKLMAEWQEKIYEFHLWLKEKGFVHRFYHGHQSFNKNINNVTWPDNVWVKNNAHENQLSFTGYSQLKGFKPDEYLHYDYEAHKQYADFLEDDLMQMLKEIKQ